MTADAVTRKRLKIEEEQWGQMTIKTDGSGKPEMSCTKEEGSGTQRQIKRVDLTA